MTSTSNSTTSVTGATTPMTGTSNSTSDPMTGTSNSTSDPMTAECEAICTRQESCLVDLCEEGAREGLDARCLSNCLEGSQEDLELLREETCSQVREAACEAVTAGCTCDRGAPLGGACLRDTDCAPSERGLEVFCQRSTVDDQGEETGFVGGYCVHLGCEESGDCGEGALCAFQAPATMVCYAGCDPSEGTRDRCRQGYGCWSFFNDGACLPACTADGDCGVGEICDGEGTGACR